MVPCEGETASRLPPLRRFREPISSQSRRSRVAWKGEPPRACAMKTAAVTAFRQQLAADRPPYGLWVTLESPSITEMAVALGLDWVVIDAEHGHLDWKEIVEHVRAAVRSTTVVLVRVAELNG